MTDAELTDAAVAALTAELGRTLTDVETAQAKQRVKGALVVIRGRLGQSLEGVEDDALVYVLGEVLLARSLNPNGFKSETIDDYTYQFGSETRKVTILDDWWAVLRPVGRASAFTVRPTFTSDAVVPWRGGYWR